MKKKRDEAAYLESQADRLEQFVDFNDPRPAVFPKLNGSPLVHFLCDAVKVPI